MLIPILFVLLLSGASIAQMAKARGLKPFAWVLATVLSFFIGIFVACTVLSIILLYKYPALFTLVQNKDKAGMNEFFIQNLSANFFLYSTLLFAGAIGGYLLVRFILEKKK